MDFAQDAGTIIIFVGAVVGALTILVKAPPVRWLLRTVVKEPLIEAFRREVRVVLDERPLTNGWGTDAVKAIAKAVDADVDPPNHPGP